MQTAQVLAGFSLGEADLLRRAMSKKNADVIQKERRSSSKAPLNWADEKK